MLLVDRTALAPQQHVQPTITEPSALLGERLQSLAKFAVIRPPGLVAHAGPIAVDHPARPPLAHLIGLLQIDRSLPMRSGRHHFFPSRSFNATLSSMASASRRFSFAPETILMNSAKHHPPSRRDVMSAGTVGLALASSQSGFAQASSMQEEREDLRDPQEIYPKPPFKRQSQPWPGLASRMDPRPDHGESSYRGSGRLAGRRALVTGGDSGMGRAAAIAFAREGADVAINHLPEEEPDAKEVIDLIKAEGRAGISIQATSGTRPFASIWSKKPCSDSAASTFWSAMQGINRPARLSSMCRPRTSTRQ